MIEERTFHKIEFHKITLEDKAWITEKMRQDNPTACEYTFANNYVWGGVYEVQVAQIADCGVIRFRSSDAKIGYSYSFPFGAGRKKEAVDALRDFCHSQGKALQLSPFTEENRQLLQSWYPGEFLVETDRGSSDYVYTVEKLSTLKGRKLHGKRNHIARFMDDGDWSYEPLTQENKDACQEMAHAWSGMRQEKWNEEMEQELGVLDRALHDYEELGLIGGVLRKAGEIVAFAIGEPLNDDTIVVHFEKAFPDLQGAYPMINQQFVLHECQNFTYVNREEDTGDTGLRKAKLSYYPDQLITKYTATESEVVNANPEDKEQIILLWQTCFGDSREYVEHYLEKRFTQENMLLIWEDGKPVAMASFLPMRVVRHDRKKPARYVYAVATLPQYRGRGYAAKLIAFAQKRYQEPLVLSPQEESLKNYYQKLGFRSAFCEGQESIEQKKRLQDTIKPRSSGLSFPVAGQALGDYQTQSADATTYKQLRDRHFTKEGYVRWDVNAIAYAIEENAFCGGEALLLTLPSENLQEEAQESVTELDNAELILYRKEKDVLLIIETTLPLDERSQAVWEELLAACDCTSLQFPSIEGMLWRSKKHVTILPADWGYLNLILG